MNQILVTKIKKNYKKFFKFQFEISVIAILFLMVYYWYNYDKTKDGEEISKILNKNMELSKMYKIEEQSLQESLYLGKIRIKKLNMEYPIFNYYNEELLKIAPCKFYGENIGDSGNICIAGHNYDDNRFFGRLNELNNDDEIKLVDLNNNEYIYIIFDKFETEETNVESVIRKKKAYELTLLTCNNTNKKRVVIKAYLKR